MTTDAIKEAVWMVGEGEEPACQAEKLRPECLVV
jgi:hypothetical protein